MRTPAPCVLLALACACSKSSGSASPQDPPGEPYALARSALSTDHPRTLPEFARAVGRAPLGCGLVNATCECTWRFVTADGVKDIVAYASFPDERTTAAETVSMVTRGGPVDLPADEAERGYRAGDCRAAPGERYAVSNGAGAVASVASADLTEALNMGGHLASPRALKAAELEKTYASWTAAQRAEACTTHPGRVLWVEMQGQTTDW
jgi:hypothetical protein